MKSTTVKPIARAAGFCGAGLIAAIAALAWPGQGSAAGQAPQAAAPPSNDHYHLVPLSDDRLAFGARINAKGQVAFNDLFGPDPGVYRARFFDGKNLHTLNTFGGNNSLALGLNRHGQVTGYADTAFVGGQDDPFHAFRWSKDTGLVDIGRPPLLSSYGADIADQGDIAGAAVFGPGGTVFHAARWRARHRARDLGTLYGGSSAATAINDDGTVVGWSQASDNPALRVPFRWTRERGMQALGTLASEGATATDVNDDGYIVGTASLVQGAGEHAFLWSPHAGIIDLGSGSGTSSAAIRLNQRGTVIGNISKLPAFGVGFVWTRSDGLVEIGKLGVNTSIAEDLNKHGQVVGAFDGRAFVWSRARGISDLNTLVRHAPPGLVLLHATAINDGGAIVASTNTGLVLLSTQAISDQRPLVGPILVSGVQQAGATLSFAASFTDIDRRDTHTAVWDWGEGAPEPATLNERGGSGSVSAQHRYPDPGEFIVRLTVTDSSGKRTTVRWQLTISEAP